MIALKELNYDDIDYLRSKYSINLDLNMENPIFTYVFYEDEMIVGYSQVQAFGNEMKMIAFECEKENENEKLFYLKSTGLKVYNLGYHYIVNDNIIFQMDRKIILHELFKGNCNGD